MPAPNLDDIFRGVDINAKGLSKNDFTDSLFNDLNTLLSYLRPMPRFLPAGLTWDSEKYPLGPITLHDSSGPDRAIGAIGKTAQQLFDEHSIARSNPGRIFYVKSNGSDTNNGLTAATPFRSISKAVTEANLAGVPTRVNIISGLYHKNINPVYNTSTGGSIIPSVDIAFVNTPDPASATIQRVVTGVFEGEASFSWVVDGTYTNCYSSTLTGTDQFERVVDTYAYNDFGNWQEFTYVANPTICNATPGTWTNVGAQIYVHRSDKKAVSFLNTRVYRSGAYSFRFTNPGVNVYLEGIDVEGGGVTPANGLAGAGITVNIQFPNNAAKTVFVVNDCSFKYSGGRINTTNTGVGFHQCNGLMALFNCRIDANMTDGINAHNLTGDANHIAQQPYLIAVNSTRFDNGRQGNFSSNGFTMHDNVIGIDITGFDYRNHGGSIRNIGNSKTWVLGSLVRDDFGDRWSSSTSLFPVGVMADDNAQVWVENVKVDMPGGVAGFYANIGSTIRKRNCWSGGLPDSGPGTITNF